MNLMGKNVVFFQILLRKLEKKNTFKIALQIKIETNLMIHEKKLLIITFS